jgi:hypothetical protein
MSSLPIKRRKTQIVVEEAARDAEKIIRQTKEAMGGMSRILGGILRKSADEQYDTLSNLSVLAGRDTAFLDGVADSASQFRRVLQLLADIDAMEAGR